MSEATGGLIATLRGHADSITCVAFSPDGAILASSSLDTTVRLWNVATGEEIATLHGHPSRVNAVAFSPDGTLLASVNGIVWAPAPPLRFSEHGTPCTSTPENDTPMPFVMILWDMATGTEQMRWEVETPMYTVAFSPDGRTLAANGGAPSEDSSGPWIDAVRLWNIATGELEAILQESQGETVWSIAFSPDGTTLASGNQSRVTLWNMATGEVKTSLGKDMFRSVVFSPDGTLLASSDFYGVVRLWDVATGEERATLGKHEGTVRGLAFSPDGTILASAGQDGIARLWDVTTTDNVATIRIPRTWVGGVAFSPDGTLLATGSSDGLIRLWNVAEVLGQ